jgi:hypothetical protein
MDYHHHESKYKPQPRRRSGKDNPPRGGPKCGNAGSAKPTAATFAIYAGRDRLGSYCHDGTAFEAFDRRGRSLGLFGTQRECLDAIEREAKS